MLLRVFCTIFLFSWIVPSNAVDTGEIARRIAGANERFWISTAEPKPNVTSRGLFAYAFALCEAGQNLDRLERLFDLAARMQDRDPQSRSYGNFKWKWSDETIVDYNAVDFSMRGGSLLWLKHKDKIPAPARAKLRELLEFATEGCLRHRVSESYTNIALMNAGDLILLGEAFDKPKVADEGYKRLERVLLYTHEFGTHEYVSPTYYGPDLDALVMIEAYARRPQGVAQARALLEYFWHDIALNWFPPAHRLAGAHSRSYDYLHGLGELDRHLQLNGWLAGEPTNIDTIYSAQARWKPSPELKKLSEQFPRLVQQRWGVESAQWRTHFLLKDVTLSTAGASYGGKMDFPLTVDFSGEPKSVRCYFTSDARGDAYGQIKIAESATHSKALHLSPFWAATQQKNDALGLVLYRDKDIPPDSESLESHFVMPFDNDGLWIGERPIRFEKGKAASFPVVAPDDVVVLRKGSAAVDVRVGWTRDVKGQVAPVHLVYDGNAFGAIRLTVTHYRGAKIGPVEQKSRLVGAAFFVHVSSGLGPIVHVSSDLGPNYDLQPVRDRGHRFGAGKDGDALHLGVIAPPADPLEITVNPALTAVSSRPAPSRAVLSLDGADIGKKILEAVEPLKSAVHGANVPELKLPAAGGVYFEAESGQVMPAFETGDDAAASGDKFVWRPGEPGVGGGSALGSMTWKLNVAQAGELHLWGRVQAPTPDDDSFFVRALRDGEDVLPATTWSVGTHATWEWVRFAQPLALPQGEAQLQLRVREDGARIDRLFLTRDANEVPQ